MLFSLLRAAPVRHQLGAAALSAATACGGGGSTAEPEPEGSKSGPLVSAAAWELMADAEDPFAGERPPGAMCDSLGYAPEFYEDELGFFVETGICNYATFEQPALVEVAKGDELLLRLFHYDLTAPEAAEGRVVLLFGKKTLFDETFEIPSPEELVERTIAAPSDLAKGQPIRFHVRNHGDNNWVLFGLSSED